MLTKLGLFTPISASENPYLGRRVDYRLILTILRSSVSAISHFSVFVFLLFVFAICSWFLWALFRWLALRLWLCLLWWLGLSPDCWRLLTVSNFLSSLLISLVFGLRVDHRKFQTFCWLGLLPRLGRFFCAFAAATTSAQFIAVMLQNVRYDDQADKCWTKLTYLLPVGVKEVLDSLCVDLWCLILATWGEKMGSSLKYESSLCHEVDGHS